MGQALRGCTLIIEDNEEAGRLLADVVSSEGFEPIVSRTAAEGLEAFRRCTPDAVLLDWVLPDRAGLEVCRELRGADPLLPIIFVSGRAEDASVTRALDAGADDFVCKPISQVVLIARLEAHLRKAAAAAARTAAAPASDDLLVSGEIELDVRARRLRVAGEEVTLGPIEFDVLEHLARHAGQALSRGQIAAQVYGTEDDGCDERVALIIRRLRKKLGPGARRAGLVVAVAGYGFRLERV